MSAIETVQGIYAAFGRGDVAAILNQISEDVSWENGAPEHGIPWLKPGRGRDHVAAFFGTVARELEITHFDLQQLYVAGDQLIAQIAIEASVKSTGKALKDLELHHWQLDANGRVIAFRHVVDTHQHWLASR